MLLGLLMWAGFSRAGKAQGQVFIHLTSVEVTQLSNGVRIEFNFDGTFNLRYQPVPEWVVFRPGVRWPPDPQKVRVIRFTITNARTQAGAFFDVSRYPVSHVELSIPPGAPEGVGLNAAVVLSQPAMFKNVRTREDDWCCFDTTTPSFDLRESQDRRKLIVTVLSDRLPQQPEVRREPKDLTAGHPGELSIRNEGGVLSVRALNAPLAAFSLALAEATGLQVTVDDETQRIIHMHLPAVTLRETLDLLMRSYNLSVGPHPLGAGYWITDGSPRSGSRVPGMETGVVPFRNVSIYDALDLYPDFLRRYLRPNVQENALIVTGNAALIDKVRRDAAVMDAPPSQVEVELLAVEASSLEELRAGLQLETQQGEVNVRTDPGRGEVSMRVIDAPAPYWQARLRALETSGAVRIRSQSKVRVLNGRAATLFVGGEKLIPVRVGRFRQETVAIEVLAGTRLEVTPWIGASGDVTLSLLPSVSAIVGRDPATGLPTLDTREAKTMIRTQDGHTILFGGLEERSEYKTRRKIPLLGDLPLIGNLFREKQTQKTGSEIVFLITPRLVGTSGEAAPALQVGASLRPLVGG
ncbi:MAG: type II and III secretion system protein [Armatimonadetes bacterium]|nr:type II and III secretion system protein [Armatimonadota bacterium]